MSDAYQTKTFTNKELFALGLPAKMDADRGRIISDEITDHLRWSVMHSITFELDGVIYRTWYTIGATESQDEDAWEYQDEVECTVMKEKRVTVSVYEAVKISEPTD